MNILISALIAFQFLLLLVPILSVKWLLCTALSVFVAGCIYEVIVSVLVPVDSNPIRIDILFLAPFLLSYIAFAISVLLPRLMPSRSRIPFFKGLLFVCDCIITMVTAWILL